MNRSLKVSCICVMQICCWRLGALSAMLKAALSNQKYDYILGEYRRNEDENWKRKYYEPSGEVMPGQVRIYIPRKQ